MAVAIIALSRVAMAAKRPMPIPRGQVKQSRASLALQVLNPLHKVSLPVRAMAIQAQKVKVGQPVGVPDHQLISLTVHKGLLEVSSRLMVID